MVPLYSKIEAQILKKEKNQLAQDLQIFDTRIEMTRISNWRSYLRKHLYPLPSTAEDKLAQG